ncbi:hypothetical protein G8T75_12735 [Clostridium botulinum D/C]|uniref:hypothetical protein n=1 Tax=Clostridium botulinum TaxID=1491 RepID=UPI001E53795C|nr:hypothetical protein [Clostridium botulinum]MCD3240823.1 hypothetical protein [Clostridium botulinum D/C]
MTNLKVLKIKLGKKEYFDDEEYTLFLSEKDLNAEDEYTKDNQIKILEVAINVLTSVSCNDNMMRKMSSELGEQGEMTKVIQNAIANLQEQINKIEDEKLNEKHEDQPSIRPMFFNAIRGA